MNRHIPISPATKYLDLGNVFGLTSLALGVCSFAVSTYGHVMRAFENFPTRDDFMLETDGIDEKMIMVFEALEELEEQNKEYKQLLENLKMHNIPTETKSTS